jgi:hypothetical protein
MRKPWAALAVVAVAQAYVLVADRLPAIEPVDLSLLVAGLCGSAAIYACLAATAPAWDVPVQLAVLTVGGLAVAVVLALADVGAAATPIEAIAYGALGAWLAGGLVSPGLALGLPVFVAVVDVISTLAGGLSEHIANSDRPKGGDLLTLELPEWHTGLSGGRLGVSDVVFAGVFLLFARRVGLRPRATVLGMWAGTMAAITLAVLLDHAVPALPFIAAGYFAANADRLPGVLEAARRG